MVEKFNTILSIALLPQIIEIIAEREDIDEMSALRAFYSSETYALLSREETALWHYSPLMLYTMWKSEMMYGKIAFPEESA